MSVPISSFLYFSNPSVQNSASRRLQISIQVIFRQNNLFFLRYEWNNEFLGSMKIIDVVHDLKNKRLQV